MKLNTEINYSMQVIQGIKHMKLNSEINYSMKVNKREKINETQYWNQV